MNDVFHNRKSKCVINPRSRRCVKRSGKIAKRDLPKRYALTCHGYSENKEFTIPEGITLVTFRLPGDTFLISSTYGNFAKMIIEQLNNKIIVDGKYLTRDGRQLETKLENELKDNFLKSYYDLNALHAIGKFYILSKMMSKSKKEIEKDTFNQLKHFYKNISSYKMKKYLFPIYDRFPLDNKFVLFDASFDNKKSRLNKEFKQFIDLHGLDKDTKRILDNFKIIVKYPGTKMNDIYVNCIKKYSQTLDFPQNGLYRLNMSKRVTNKNLIRLNSGLVSNLCAKNIGRPAVLFLLTCRSSGTTDATIMNKTKIARKKSLERLKQQLKNKEERIWKDAKESLKQKKAVPVVLKRKLTL